MGFGSPVRGHALGIAFAADPFGLLFALTAAVIGAILLMYTLSELGGSAAASWAATRAFSSCCWPR